MTTPTLFQGEAQLRRWSNTSTQGPQITLALHDADALHSWVGKEGMRVMLVAVLIGDDEEPVAVLPAQLPVKPGQEKRSVRAWKLCRHPQFLDFLDCNNEAEGKLYMLSKFGIESRSELDTSQDAADQFDLLCGDYNDWAEAYR